LRRVRGHLRSNEPPATIAVEQSPQEVGLRTVADDGVLEVKLLPSTNVPKAVFVALAPSGENALFVRNLYATLVAINASDSLTGTSGPNQAIRMVVSAPSQDVWDALAKDLRTDAGVDANAELPQVVSVVSAPTATGDDAWTQGLGEFAAVKGQDYDGYRYGVLDAWNGHGLDLAKIADAAALPMVALPAALTSFTSPTAVSANAAFGGNTRATPEGHLFVGDAVPPAYLNDLVHYGNEDASVVPSKFLDSGRVGDYLTYVPAKNRCSAALIVGSPLAALNLLVANVADFATDPRFPVPPGDIVNGLAELAGSVHAQYTLADLRGGTADDDPASLSPGAQFVLYNLAFEQQIADAVSDLDDAGCVVRVDVPQLYKARPDGKRALPVFPSATSALVLRGHAVVNDPGNERLRSTMRDRYVSAFGHGLRDNVHFVNAAATANGVEVPCGATVIREIGLPFAL
jgi:hypothetical protein